MSPAALSSSRSGSRQWAHAPYLTPAGTSRNPGTLLKCLTFMLILQLPVLLTPNPLALPPPLSTTADRSDPALIPDLSLSTPIPVRSPRNLPARFRFSPPGLSPLALLDPVPLDRLAASVEDAAPVHWSRRRHLGRRCTGRR